MQLMPIHRILTMVCDWAYFSHSKEHFHFILGQICGYELSLHKHDDSAVDQTAEQIPFLVEFNNGQAIIKLKSTMKKLDCEIKQTYSLFIRAYDCADAEQRRYSERYLHLITFSIPTFFVLDHRYSSPSMISMNLHRYLLIRIIFLNYIKIKLARVVE